MRATQATAKGSDKYTSTLPPPGVHYNHIKAERGDYDGRVKTEINDGEALLNIRVGTREKSYLACIILDENDLVDLLTDLRLHKRESSKNK